MKTSRTNRKSGDSSTKASNAVAAKGRAALVNLRHRIDKVDDELVALLDRRAALAVRTAALKQEMDVPLFQPHREAEVVARVLKSARTFPRPSLQAVYREIMGASLALERTLRVAVLGPEGTYTHMAAVKRFGGEASLVFSSTNTDIFTAVEKGEADVGVVPIENSIEGAVVHTLDNLVESSLSIAEEILLPIHHNLLVHPRVLKKSPPKLSRILSHPQPLAQCRGYLESRYAGVATRETSSTTAAAMEAARHPGVAAIASELAAKLYGLAILDSGIEDRSGNTTRFLLLRKSTASPLASRLERAPSSNGMKWKTSIAFSMKDKPGALYRMLESFKKYEVNLSKIESRPAKVRAWRYTFFLDMEGHASSPRISRAMTDLEAHCAWFRLLGSYPEAITSEASDEVLLPRR